MKIILVTQYFAPAWAYGGPPKVLFNLSKELIKLGHEVIVLTTDSLGSSRNSIFTEKINGINIYRLKTLSNRLAYRCKLFIVPDMLNKLKENLEDADYVLYSDLRTLINWQTYRLLLSEKIPYGIFSFGQIPYDKSWKGIVKKIYDFMWVRDFVTQAKYRFCQTEHERKMYGEYFQTKKENTQLLLLPIDTKAYMPCDNVLNFYRKKLHIESQDKVFLFVGRLHYLKGVDILIRCMQTIMRKDKKVKFLIVGRDDGEKNNLVNMVPAEFKKRIIFLPPLYNEELASIYKLSKCFIIVPRFYEETSTAALEALSYGIPVITNDKSEIPYLEEYNAGFITLDDQLSILVSVRKILTMKTKIYKIMRMNAQKIINEKYHSKIIVHSLLKYLS